MPIRRRRPRAFIGRIAIACCAAVLLGCGASEEERVADAVAAYPRAIAARDGDAACEVLTRDARSQVGAEESCDPIGRIGKHLTADQRKRYENAEGVDVEITGDTASARLRIGDCILRLPLELARDDDGDWRISEFSVDYDTRAPRCL